MAAKESGGEIPARPKKRMNNVFYKLNFSFRRKDMTTHFSRSLFLKVPWTTIPTARNFRQTPRTSAAPSWCAPQPTTRAAKRNRASTRENSRPELRSPSTETRVARGRLRFSDKTVVSCKRIQKSCKVKTEFSLLFRPDRLPYLAAVSDHLHDHDGENDDPGLLGLLPQAADSSWRQPQLPADHPDHRPGPVPRDHGWQPDVR